MEEYVIELLNNLKPERMSLRRSRNEREFMFVRDKAKKILVLNSTAREIYGACNGASIGEIIRAMSIRYPKVDIKTLSSDTLRCLRDFEVRGLVKLR